MEMENVILANACNFKEAGLGYFEVHPKSWKEPTEWRALQYLRS